MQDGDKLRISPIKANFSEILSKIDKFWVIGLIAGLLVATFSIDINIDKESAYIVKVNGQKIGAVKGVDVYNDVLSSIELTDGKNSLEKISFEKINFLKTDFLSKDELELSVRKELGLKAKVVAVKIDGQEVARVKSQKEYEKLLEDLKKYYYPKVDGEIKIISATIREKIEPDFVWDYYKNTQDIDDVIQKIADGQMLTQEYEVKKGDTIWDISLNNDISIEDIKLANPDLNIDKIQIGQKIKFIRKKPYVNVEIVAQINGKEEIPYDTKKIVDKNIKKGIEKIKEKGQTGLAYIEKKVFIVNDSVVQEDVLNTEVLKEPKDEVLIVGGKAHSGYVAFSGGFIRPSRGRLTSGFKFRWGRRHEGIDLASPTGTPIYAAASGKVIYAGWKSGYGKCIIISHSNGFTTLYGHASKLYVSIGEYVNKGEKIAAVGSTGRSTGPHLHFEVRKYGTPVDPLKYIR
ncbi:Murein DD-endopeptidase MepM [Caloramator mitchellensis]|uniref:Murein DD-endopeptidase MepM n=1 Tax=Caloramator mitchellensis TaxID=908809 RepID=A0A0R3K082_CALMK|nr:M23 family metallopeptidase [Caloramator mitchellensis]KRQ86309.1 Murein DD-endopeptidase MepM [Caloramator mitchellensis]